MYYRRARLSTIKYLYFGIKFSLARQCVNYCDVNFTPLKKNIFCKVLVMLVQQYRTPPDRAEANCTHP